MPARLSRGSHKWIILVILLVAFLPTGCGREVPPPTPAASTTTAATRTAGPAPTATSTADTAALIRQRYRFPEQIDPTRRYILYLHGKIIEDQGLPAVSPDYGEYQYLDILQALEAAGFTVISEMRPKDADGFASARRTTELVAALLQAGVPPEAITVVGASKGALIAASASQMSVNPGVNFVLLGGCNPEMLDEWQRQGWALSGRVLSIYDEADVYAASCRPLFEGAAPAALRQSAEIVTRLGNGHGLLYRPLAEWLAPTVRWANGETP